MPIELYFGFVLATASLMLIPGPNVALIVANSVAYGGRFGLLTVAGTSTAMLVQLAFTVLSMTTLLAAFAHWFDWLRWVGVAYLVYLGCRAWTAAPVALVGTAPQPKSLRGIYLRGFFVSLTNPKTLLFYGAFLPQFVSRGSDPTDQLILLAATFVVIAVLLDGAWAVLAGRMRRLLAVHGRLRNRLAGGFLIGAGLGLALARKS